MVNFETVFTFVMDFHQMFGENEPLKNYFGAFPKIDAFDSGMGKEL